MDHPRRSERFWAAFAAFSLRRPVPLALAALLLLALSAPFAVRLYADLRTDLRELLPRGAPAAVALDALEARLGGLAHLSVVVHTEDLKAGQRFVEALAERLRPLVPSVASSIRHRIDDERAFLDKHGALYAGVDDLALVRDGLRKGRRLANPLAVDLLDDEVQGALDPAAQTALRKLRDQAGRLDRFLDGYLAGEGGKTLVVLITPVGAALALDANQRLLRAVEKVVAEVGPLRFHPSIRVGYDGEVSEVIEAQQHLIRDIEISGLLVLFLVGGVILLYYRTLRAIPLLVGPLMVGATLTFAVSRGVIHSLNPNTAFLGSIIIGNGINAGIILLARYLEERRAGAEVARALPTALSTTWLATLAASGAAAASYASLAATSFRGFNQFAFVGALGMLLCWAATYALMPAFIALTERIHPLRVGPAHFQLSARLGGWLVRRPAVAVAASAAVTVAAAALLVRFQRDPIEYDFSKLGSRQGRVDGAAYWGKRVEAVTGSYQTPTVILTATPDRAAAVAAAVEREKAAQGTASAIDSVLTEQSLLPKDQARKIELLRELFGLLDERALRALPDDVRPLARRLRDRTELREVALADVPSRLRTAFREKDGRSGRAVLVYPTLGATAEHGRVQLAFARSLRQVAERTDPAAQVAGSLVLTADIVETITRDGFFAAALSLMAVALLTVIILRSLRDAAWVIGSLGLGIFWMGGALGALDLKLNFVNFVVLSITFGIGVDYAVNLYQRYRQSGARVEEAVATSGGAVALCSATTIIGYAALLIADNQAIHSFGLTAVLGEITCLSAALVTLPALLAWRDRAAALPETG